MSSGQSLRNGNSVEPGLPNTFLMPKARRRPKVASLTVMDLLSVLVGLRDKGVTSMRTRHSGMVRRTRPGISRFRVRCFASPRNDGGVSRPYPWCNILLHAGLAFRRDSPLVRIAFLQLCPIGRHIRAEILREPDIARQAQRVPVDDI